MIKELFIGSLILASPHPYNTANSTITTTLTKNNQAQLYSTSTNIKEYGYISYIPSENYINLGTALVRTITYTYISYTTLPNGKVNLFMMFGVWTTLTNETPIQTETIANYTPYTNIQNITASSINQIYYGDYTWNNGEHSREPYNVDEILYAPTSNVHDLYTRMDDMTDYIYDDGYEFSNIISTNTSESDYIAKRTQLINKLNNTYQLSTLNYSNSGEVGRLHYLSIRGVLDTTPTEDTITVYNNFYLETYKTMTYIISYEGAVPTTEVIDIPGLIFTILGMPFAWISTAFNLTLFPGTPYSINIAVLILGLIGVLIAIFIIRRLLK